MPGRPGRRERRVRRQVARAGGVAPTYPSVSFPAYGRQLRATPSARRTAPRTELVYGEKPMTKSSSANFVTSHRSDPDNSTGRVGSPLRNSGVLGDVKQSPGAPAPRPESRTKEDSRTGSEFRLRSDAPVVGADRPPKQTEFLSTGTAPTSAEVLCVQLTPLPASKRSTAFRTGEGAPTWNWKKAVSAFADVCSEANSKSGEGKMGFRLRGTDS